MDNKNMRPMGASLTLFTIGLLVLVIGCFASWNGGELPIAIMILIASIILCAGFVVSLLERILHEMRS